MKIIATISVLLICSGCLTGPTPSAPAMLMLTGDSPGISFEDYSQPKSKIEPAHPDAPAGDVAPPMPGNTSSGDTTPDRKESEAHKSDVDSNSGDSDESLRPLTHIRSDPEPPVVVPVVTTDVFYYPAPIGMRCIPCEHAEKDFAALPDFKFIKAKPDAWEKSQKEGYPHFLWQARGKWIPFHGWYGPAAFRDTYEDSQTPKPLATGEAAHTPMAEVVRVIGLLPKPEVGFVDFGCGYDARWCVAAAERWGCKCVGIEIDSSRASAARERVKNLGLGHLIAIVEGDATEIPVFGDVGVAYLYPDVLARLKPKLEKLKAFASYLHQPPGMSVTKNGDTWLYQRQVQQVQQLQLPQSGAAVWNGAYYNQPYCNSPNCAMCNSIRRQLGYR